MIFRFILELISGIKAKTMVPLQVFSPDNNMLLIFDLCIQLSPPPTTIPDLICDCDNTGNNNKHANKINVFFISLSFFDSPKCKDIIDAIIQIV